MDASELLRQYAAGVKNFNGVSLVGVNLLEADLIGI